MGQCYKQKLCQIETLEFYGFSCSERSLKDSSNLKMFELLEPCIEFNYVFIM
jgi:hypothetical protein